MSRPPRALILRWEFRRPQAWAVRRDSSMHNTTPPLSAKECVCRARGLCDRRAADEVLGDQRGWWAAAALDGGIPGTAANNLEGHPYCAATVALLTGCHVASGLYATISLAIWSVLGPRSF